MNTKAWFLLLIGVLAGLNLATVRKSEDPIRDAQTDPILYEQKKEEEKDGKKGALLYHVRNNPRDAFFIDPPIEAEPKTPAGETVSERIRPAFTESAGWWEEQPMGPEAESSGEEAVATSPPEPLPEEEQIEEVRSLGTASEPSVPEGEAAPAPEGKGEDYWW